MDFSRLKTRNAKILTGVGAAVVILILVVVIVAVAGGGDDDDDRADTSTSTSGRVATTASATDTAEETTESSAATESDETDVSDTATSPAATTTSVAAPATTPGATTAPPPNGTTVPPAPTSMVTVPVGTLEVLEPIPSNEVGEFGTGVTVELLSMRAVQAEATVPGEISGPGIEVVLRITNESAQPLDLSTAQVEVTYGDDRSPGNAIRQGSEPFTGTLAAGSSVEGTYVYGVPADQRDVVQISVFYSVDAPVVVFEGPGPTA